MSLYPDLKDLPAAEQNTSKKKVLHFSDGTLEVDESDDSKNDVPATEFPLLEASKTRELFPWLEYHTANAASKALEICDYVGESLAAFFGITTPKYQYEINEFNRIKEEEEKARNDIEMGSWGECNLDEVNNPIQTGPKNESTK